MLYKAVELAVKDIDMSKREAVLKYATYNTLDRDEDRANKGMFTKSINEGFQDIRFFKNHNKDWAIGKPIRLWEDDNGAYAQMKFSKSTLGEDSLIMVDEGVMTNNSYAFDPIKSAPIKNKGKDFKEVKLWEISVLTHWGAHPDSLVQSVSKGKDSMPKFDLKMLSDGEAATLKRIIANGSDNLKALMELMDELEPDSDLYTTVNWYISRQSDWIGDAKSQLRYGLKEKDGNIEKLKSFIRNSKASDEEIQGAMMLLKSAEEGYDTDITTQEDDDQNEPGSSVNKELADALLLFTLKM